MENVGSEISTSGLILSRSELAKVRQKRGECLTCGRQCFRKTLFKMIPLTTDDGQVWEGQCVPCRPLLVVQEPPPEGTGGGGVGDLRHDGPRTARRSTVRDHSWPPLPRPGLPTDSSSSSWPMAVVSSRRPLPAVRSSVMTDAAITTTSRPAARTSTSSSSSSIVSFPPRMAANRSFRWSPDDDRRNGHPHQPFDRVFSLSHSFFHRRRPLTRAASAMPSVMSWREGSDDEQRLGTSPGSAPSPLHLDESNNSNSNIQQPQRPLPPWHVGGGRWREEADQ
jgi:hypothetical protein